MDTPIWRGKPVPPEWAEMALELAGEIDRLEAEVKELERRNEQLARGFSFGAARPPYGKRKAPEAIEGRAAL